MSKELSPIEELSRESKQLSPLEALERLYKESNKDFGWQRDELHKQCKNIIETALRDYVVKKAFFDNTMPILFKHKIKNHEELDKQLKALEIIKEKEVNVYWLMHYFTLDAYNQQVCTLRKLTQEEFDLLMEIFENGNRKD